MLPLPKINDRLLKQIFDESKELIPNLVPEWTDHNVHDPGITFIELFAWLIEMQENSLDRLTEKSELKFLKLLNVKIDEPKRAITDITFTGIEQQFVIPEGTCISAEEQPFETVESILAIDSNIQNVVVNNGKRFFDYTANNTLEGSVFPAFGYELNMGSALYLGFDKELPISKEISIKINLHEDYPIRRNNIEYNFDELRNMVCLKWEYAIQDENGEEGLIKWENLKVTHDDTYQLLYSGRLKFIIPNHMKKGYPKDLKGSNLFWIRCRLLKKGYEVAPRIKDITLNTVPVVHRNTMCISNLFSSKGEMKQSIELEGSIWYYGIIEVRIRCTDGKWVKWEYKDSLDLAADSDEVFSVKKSETEKKVTIIFGNGVNGKIPPEGKSSILVTSFKESFISNRLIGKSKRIPSQKFRLNWVDSNIPVFPESLQIIVGSKLNECYKNTWTIWNRVSDFDNSRGSDRHFVFEEESNQVIFGDGEHGAIPGDAEDNVILLASCELGGGINGNVKDNRITRVTDILDMPLKAFNHYASTGGRNKETIEYAKRRALIDLKKQYRAVTSEDYEKIALSTPGLMVARAKAIPLFEKGKKDKESPAQVTLVVVPYSEEKMPIPSSEFLEIVYNHVNKFRLITTEVHVIPPEYVKVKVRCNVTVKPYIKFDAVKVENLLDTVLNPIGSCAGFGWPFGGSVRKGDVISEINKLEGVELVNNLWLEVEGAAASVEKSGDIVIPPYALVFSGTHEIEIESEVV